jgi:hemoglobin
MERTSLYERLGGARGIVELVDDVVAAHMENPVIKARFLPYQTEPERMDRIKQHTVRFFAAGSGGPEQYNGRSMPDAHRGMNINEAEYMAATDDILAVLAKHGIDESTRNEVLAIAYSLKGQIMHV